MPKLIFLFALLLTSCLPQYTPAPVMAADVTPLPTATATSTPIPSPTIDNNATIVSYQNEAIQARQTAVEAIAANAAITAEFEQRVQDQLVITSQAEYINFQILGWTQTAAPTSIPLTTTQQVINNTQVAENQSLQAGWMTGTAEAPTMEVAMAIAIDEAKNMERNSTFKILWGGFFAFFLYVICAATVWAIRTYTAADIMKAEMKQEDDNPDDYKPVPAQMADYVSEEHNGINRRMEQRFAQVLLAMRELKPNDEAVNLLELFWIVRGARDKFQSRNEFLAVRDDWASDENGILLRRDPTVPNSTFYVAKWDEVKLIANGERL
jgi:hypothetical protein